MLKRYKFLIQGILLDTETCLGVKWWGDVKSSAKGVNNGKFPVR